jgi:hypothetical protein
MNEIRKAIAAIRRQLAKARYTIISIRYQFADEDDETTLEYGGDGSEEGRLKAAEEFLEQVGLSENETVSEVVREVARQGVGLFSKRTKKQANIRSYQKIGTLN